MKHLYHRGAPRVDNDSAEALLPFALTDMINGLGLMHTEIPAFGNFLIGYRKMSSSVPMISVLEDHQYRDQELPKPCFGGGIITGYELRHRKTLVQEQNGKLRSSHSDTDKGGPERVST
jgi:hypothetical protein